MPDGPWGYVDRLPRLASLWLDRDFGLLRWAPVLALVFFAAWLLYRSRRDQLARGVAARRGAEACTRRGLPGGVAGGAPARRRRADGMGAAPRPALAGRAAGRGHAGHERLAD